MPSNHHTQLLLGIDTCGPAGSVALGSLAGEAIEILEQIELEGRTYSANLVTAVSHLLSRASAKVSDLGCIVAVNGPGGFTGVRVGLSAVKGLAEVAQIPVTAVSRLEVLAWKAGVRSSALDAHRHEVFLRMSEATGTVRELLAGLDELAAINPLGEPIAICDDAAAMLLSTAWPSIHPVRTDTPTGADALRLCAARVAQGDFVDLALLDGHYLRRSDAEIFGGAATVQGA